MERRRFVLGGALLSTVPLLRAAAEGAEPAMRLPAPREDGTLSVEAALRRRRSIREFAVEPLSLADAAQLLWAAQGITGPGGLKTAPSGGALYPMELLLAVGAVSGLEPGAYAYDPLGHALTPGRPGDPRTKLAVAAHGQDWVRDAPAALVLCAIYERSTVKYGERGVRYGHIEVGHIAQNVYLQAVALDLGTVIVGAFDDAAVTAALALAPDCRPLAILPVGRPALAPRPVSAPQRPRRGTRAPPGSWP